RFYSPSPSPAARSTLSLHDALPIYRRAHHGVVGGAPGDVCGVQERGALETDLDERRLHAGQHARYAPLVQVAHEPAAAQALDVDLLHRAVLEDGGAGLARRDVDQDLDAQRFRLQNAARPASTECPLPRAAPPSRTAAGP